MGRSEEIQMLRECLHKIGIHAENAQLEQLIDYRMLIEEWNKKINLTAILGAEETADKHFADSLLPFSSLSTDKMASLADIGTGAGLPGIPIKILYPHMEVTLIDALRKRVDFLGEVCCSLGLTGVNCLHARAEEAGRMPELRGKFDLCVTRAVGKANTLLEYAAPLLREEGLFLAYKGKGAGEELAGCKNAMQKLNMDCVQTVTASLPLSGDERNILVFRKTGPTDNKYPRRTGVPDKKPL